MKTNMKKTFSLMILGLLMVSAMGAVSAATYISGRTYDAIQSSTTNIVPVGNASVDINCTHNNIVYTKTTFSDETNGDFNVKFPSGECKEGDFFIITAVKGELRGSENGIVHDGEYLMTSMDWGIGFVPMVPEFGFFMGMLTILSAVGVFFVIRRE